MKRQTRGRGGRRTKSQENVSLLSHSAFCIALSLLKATGTNCDASNEN